MYDRRRPMGCHSNGLNVTRLHRKPPLNGFQDLCLERYYILYFQSYTHQCKLNSNNNDVREPRKIWRMEMFVMFIVLFKSVAVMQACKFFQFSTDDICQSSVLALL